MTMEDVWKDITLSSLYDHPSTTHHHLSLPTALNHQHHNPHPSSTTDLPHILLQDFLSHPFSKDPPTTTSSSFSIPQVPPPPSLPPPQPPTVLVLNTHLQQSHPGSNPSFHTPFNANFGPSFSLPSFGNYKRFQPPDHHHSGDKRNKRLIKNRESAARSRARKQAYTNELELELAHLMEENARLKKQQQQLCVAAAARLPKKHALQRASTAPF